MLYSLVDILQKKRRLIYVALFISIDIWLLLFCTQTLQAHRPNITARIHTYETADPKPTYEGDTLGNMMVGLNHGATTVQIAVLRATVATIDGTTKTEQALQAAGSATLHGIGAAASATGRAVVGSLAFVGNACVSTLGFIGRVIAFPFVMTGKGVHYAFGAVTGATKTQLSSVIQPNKAEDDAPTITLEQAEQVSLIQKDTLAVTPVKPSGAGGACDNGAGNGGYPMEWCDARMDSVQTVSYSADRINRQCTSYAFWYFTTILGHTDFHVTGNANRWAYTSNYPTHATPAVGAIAVQTAGYYGHVAIVQALPGQTYDGKVVPDGYVLVSEMNYDWQGHFRYSYSPLGKFSAYIYP